MAMWNLGWPKVFQPGAGPNPNTQPILKKAEALHGRLQKKACGDRGGLTEEEQNVAADLALYILYHRHIEGLYGLAGKANRMGPVSTGKGANRLGVAWFDRFEADVESLLTLGKKRLRPGEIASSLFALYFQMARAFDNIFAKFIGNSAAAIALRGSMWESIFTHDLARYWQDLKARLNGALSATAGGLPHCGHPDPNHRAFRFGQGVGGPGGGAFGLCAFRKGKATL